MLLTAFGNFGLPCAGLFGLVVSFWLMMVLYLACWMGLLGVILLFVLCGFGFGCFAGILLFGPTEVGRVYRLLDMVSEGCPGHGPVHLLSASAAEIGFRWDHFRAAVLGAWRDKVSADLCSRKGFRGGPLLDVHGALLRSIMVGGVWNGFLLGRVRSQPTPCRFCGAPDGDGHLFWECTFPPLVEIRESPEFHDLVKFIGLAACFGMAGFLCCPVSMVPLFGTLMLLRVLVTWLRSRLGVILLTC